MAIMLSRRLLTLAALVILGTALVWVGVKTRPAASAEPAATQSQPVSPATTSAVTVSPTPPVSTPGQDTFFAEYRLERDRAFSLEASLLTDVVNNPQSTAEARQNAQDELLRLSQQQARLVDLEGLVHAEGYAAAAVFLENQGVTVVVGPGRISATAAARLVQVLARQAGVPAANVAIIQRP
ncbi:MAG TPA: SpoIIIAH-like family protein [Spirochaetia bacterium]|nr:SpoIIIAH-like family protein [Spirochaetia bacterium]